MPLSRDCRGRGFGAESVVDLAKETATGVQFSAAFRASRDLALPRARYEARHPAAEEAYPRGRAPASKHQEIEMTSQGMMAGLPPVLTLHIGAEICKDHGSMRAGRESPEIDDANPVERRRVLRRFSGLCGAWRNA